MIGAGAIAISESGIPALEQGPERAVEGYACEFVTAGALRYTSIAPAVARQRLPMTAFTVDSTCWRSVAF